MYTAEEHKKMLANIRDAGVATGVRIIVPKHACPVCRHFEGGYKFAEEATRPIPPLPLEGCSCIGGCKAHYAPILDRHGP